MAYHTGRPWFPTWLSLSSLDVQCIGSWSSARDQRRNEVCLALLSASLVASHNDHVLFRFPANEHISGASKIPTVIYYDRKGVVRAVGAEAMREGIFEQAEEEQWIKAEW